MTEATVQPKSSWIRRFFERMYSTKGELNRKEYIISIFVYLFILRIVEILILHIILAQYARLIPGFSRFTFFERVLLSIPEFILDFIFLVYPYVVVCIKRLKYLNYTIKYLPVAWICFIILFHVATFPSSGISWRLALYFTPVIFLILMRKTHNSI